ncbi:hypothetical protein FRB99_008475 [Tulasnella sp. 403]|nr:hypothetical protein FRB99_008475 [Tulasnella sp. 403]
MPNLFRIARDHPELFIIRKETWRTNLRLAWSTPPRVPLPLELLSLICEVLQDDPKSLAMLSLVSRTFRLEAERVLYRHLTAVTGGDVPKYHEALRLRPQRRPLVRRVDILFSVYRDILTPLQTQYYASLLSQCPNLETLKVHLMPDSYQMIPTEEWYPDCLNIKNVIITSEPSVCYFRLKTFLEMQQSLRQIHFTWKREIGSEWLQQPPIAEWDEPEIRRPFPSLSPGTLLALEEVTGPDDFLSIAIPGRPVVKANLSDGIPESFDMADTLWKAASLSSVGLKTLAIRHERITEGMLPAIAEYLADLQVLEITDVDPIREDLKDKAG